MFACRFRSSSKNKNSILHSEFGCNVMFDGALLDMLDVHKFLFINYSRTQKRFCLNSSCGSVFAVSVFFKVEITWKHRP